MSGECLQTLKQIKEKPVKSILINLVACFISLFCAQTKISIQDDSTSSGNCNYLAMINKQMPAYVAAHKMANNNSDKVV